MTKNNSTVKNRHKIVNLGDKKSQTSEKMTKSHEVVQKRHKLV